MSNSTGAMAGPNETDFANPFQCYSWHVLHQNVSYDEAVNICSWFEEVPFGEVVTVFYVLVGVAIVVINGLVLWGIIAKQQLHQPMYFYVANLAVTDLLAGAMILWCVHDRVDNYKPYNVLVLRAVTMYSQIMSATALNLLALDRFVAVKYPIFYHNQAAHAKRNAGVAIVSSWTVLALLVFSVLMGWNCMEEQHLRYGHCIGLLPIGYIIFSVFLMLLLVSVLLSINVIVYQALKLRHKMKQVKPKESPKPNVVNDQEQKIGQEPDKATKKESITSSSNSTTRTEKKQSAVQHKNNKTFHSIVHNARTVMIFAIIAVVFWLLGLTAMFVKWCLQKSYPEKNLHKEVLQWAVLAFCLNSVVNPLAGISRLADLREAIGQQLCCPLLASLCTCQGKTSKENRQSVEEKSQRQEQEMVAMEMGTSLPADHTVRGHHTQILETAI